MNVETKLLLSVSTFFLLTPVAFATVTYTRTPSGSSIHAPVTITVSADSYSDFGLPMLDDGVTAQDDYWGVQIWEKTGNGDLNYTSLCNIASTTLSHSFVFDLQPNEYASVVIGGTSDPVMCDGSDGYNVFPHGGVGTDVGTFLEGAVPEEPYSAVIFTVSQLEDVISTPQVTASSHGGGGGCSAGFVWDPSKTACIQTAALATPTVPATPAIPQGQVLGAAVYNFSNDLAVGSRGADVTALQQSLIDAGYAVPDGPTGYFGAQTRAAVIAFQKARGIEQVGNVGPLTRAELNKGSTGSGVTVDQMNSILTVLQSFDVDQAMIDKVRASLTK